MSEPRLGLVFDDGFASDIEQLGPVLQSVDAPASFAVVPEWVGRDNHLTTDQLRTLTDAGHEIVSHGRRHRYLGVHRLTADADAGDRWLALDEHIFPDSVHEIRAGDTYEVTDGERTERVTIAGSDGVTGDPAVKLETELDGGYAAGEAVCRPTTATIEDEVCGVRADFEALGFDPVSFVFPYDGADPRAWRVASDTYDVLANVAIRSLPNPPTREPTDWRRSYLEVDHQTRPELAAYLDRVVELGGVGLLAGHSDWATVTPARVEWTVRAARERGIEVTTLRDAAGR